MPLLRVNSEYCEIKRLDECFDEIGTRGLEYTKVYREDELALRGLYGAFYGGLVIKVMKINFVDADPLFTIIFVAFDDDNNGKSFDQENDMVIIGCPSADRAVYTKIPKIYNNHDELAIGLNIISIAILNEIAESEGVDINFTNEFVEGNANENETFELNRNSLLDLFNEKGLKIPSAEKIDKIFEGNENFIIKIQPNK